MRTVFYTLALATFGALLILVLALVQKLVLEHEGVGFLLVLALAAAWVGLFKALVNEFD